MSLNLASLVAAARPITKLQWDCAGSGTSKGFDCALSNGRLTVESTGNPGYALSTVGHFFGKWYFEQVCDKVVFDTETPRFGINRSYGVDGAGAGDFMVDAVGFSIGPNHFAFYGGIAHDIGGPVFADGDICGIAVDFDAAKIWFAHNNSWYGAGNPAAGTNPIATVTPGGVYYPGFESANIPPHPSAIVTLRGNLAAFTYTPPAGFLPWEGY